MEREVTYITAEEWKEVYSELTHDIVFNHTRPKETDRIDYALMIGGDKPESFMTCLELDAHHVYMQHGGSFPETKGTTKSYRNFKKFVDWHFEKDIDFLSFVTENDNLPMIKLGLKAGFKIMGTRTICKVTYLEFLKEKLEDKLC